MRQSSGPMPHGYPLRRTRFSTVSTSPAASTTAYHHRIKRALRAVITSGAWEGAVQIHRPRAIELLFDLPVGKQMVQDVNGNPALLRAAKG